MPPSACPPCHSAASPTPPHRSRASRAFTLVEILVVLVIIGVVAAIAVVVARGVTGSGQARLTESVIGIMDQTLTAYQSDKGKVPAAYLDAAGTSFPLVDGRMEGREEPPASAGGKYDAIADFAQPTTALYLLMAKDVPAVQETLKGLDARFAAAEQFGPTIDAARRAYLNSDPEYQSDPQEPGNHRIRTQSGTPVDANRDPVPGFFVNDAWGNPIRLVHPKFQGGYGDYWDGNTLRANRALLPIGSGRDLLEFSRSYRPFNPKDHPSTAAGDSDEGLTVGGQPYFYSAGPDGDPGTREDNVYFGMRPTFPAETAPERFRN